MALAVSREQAAALLSVSVAIIGVAIVVRLRNRQVRRMTAKVGFPTLRLIRAAIGKVSVRGLAPGTWREVDADAPWAAA